MSSLHQKLERAVAGVLRADLSETVLGTSGGEIVVTDGGLSIALTGPGGAQTFDVRVYVGQSEDVQELPCIVVTAETGESNPYAPGNFRSTATVSVRYAHHTVPGDELQATAMEELSAEVQNVILDRAFIARISEFEASFSAFGFHQFPTTRRAVDGTTQVHETAMGIYCVEADYD